jgi:truncated hemoglobin YjbI
VTASRAVITLQAWVQSRGRGEPSLYEWVGGADAFRRLIEAFHDRVERDELIRPVFPGGVHAEHRAHVVLWLIEVFGGPPTTPISSAWGVAPPNRP